jgi:hypothetical protein
VSDCITRLSVRSWDVAVRIGSRAGNMDWMWGWIGAGDGIRTRDINLGKVALYQLSYSRACGGKDLRTAFIVALGSGESQTLSEVTTFSVSSG